MRRRKKHNLKAAAKNTNICTQTIRIQTHRHALYACKRGKGVCANVRESQTNWNERVNEWANIVHAAKYIRMCTPPPPIHPSIRILCVYILLANTIKHFALDFAQAIKIRIKHSRKLESVCMKYEAFLASLQAILHFYLKYTLAHTLSLSSRWAFFYCLSFSIPRSIKINNSQKNKSRRVEKQESKVRKNSIAQCFFPSAIFSLK